MERKITSGELLRLLDGDAISDEQRAAILAKLIDLELEKPEAEVDRKLIDECFAYLAELSEEEPKTDEELQAGLLRISFRAPTPRPMHRHRRMRPAMVLAAALLTAALFLGAALNLAGTAKENRQKETLARWEKHLLELQLLHTLQGDQSSESGDTVSTDPSLPSLPAEERSDTYSSVSVWLSKEHMPGNTLYLDALPDGAHPDRILHTVFADGTFQASFSYEGAGIQFLVTNRNVAQYAHTGEQQRFTVGNCVFSVFQRTDGRYQANYQTGSYAYSLTANDEQTLLLTLYCIRGTGVAG